MFGFGARTMAGLDIGSSSIKVVELKRSRGSLEAVHCGLEDLPRDLVVDSMIADAGTVSTAIARLFAAAGIKTPDLVTAVSGHSVIMKKITLPIESDQALPEAIQREATLHIPFDLADVNLDYQVLTEQRDRGQLEILLVAVKKDKILNYTQALSLAGKNAAVVDIDSLALLNCYEYNYAPGPGDVVALLNLGASILNINIVKGSCPLFPRDVSMGGHQYTEALQRELELSYEEAEALKRSSVADSPHADSLRADRHDADSDNVDSQNLDARLPILKQVSESIVLEIQKTFDFFRASAEGEPITKIYLAGGSSRVEGLAEALQEEFSLPVEFLDPFLRISRPTRADAAEVAQHHPEQMAVAVGLALRSFDDL